MAHGRRKHASDGTAKAKAKKADRASSAGSVSAFDRQLQASGLTIRAIPADGNCLFSAIADQLALCRAGRRPAPSAGDVRDAIVDFVEAHADRFQPFVFDATVAEYCRRMRRAGEWGGHIELQAAVTLYEVHIVVHQLNAPRLVMSHPTVPRAPTLNLSYHDREHYASCHPCSGRASPSPPDAITKQERIIMEQAQCTDLERVRDLILQLHGDTDACVECLIAERDASAQATTGRDEAAQAGRRMSKHDRKMMKKAAKVKVKAKGAVDDVTDRIADVYI